MAESTTKSSYFRNPSYLSCTAPPVLQKIHLALDTTQTPPLLEIK